MPRDNYAVVSALVRAEPARTPSADHPAQVVPSPASYIGRASSNWGDYLVRALGGVGHVTLPVGKFSVNGRLRRVAFSRRSIHSSGSGSVAIPRMIAAVALLAAALLVHVALPHHTPALTAAGAVPAVESDPRQTHGLTPSVPLAQTGSEHQGESADLPALLPRAAQTVADPAEFRDIENLPASGPAVPGQVQWATARDACNPSVGITPSPSSLQTFRC